MSIGPGPDATGHHIPCRQAVTLYLKSMDIHDFDNIRPFEPCELREAIDSLFCDQQFCTILQSFYKDIPLEVLKTQLESCPNALELQKTFIYPLIRKLIQQCCKEVTMDTSNIAPADRKGSFTFISNHRDIVLDSAFLNILLIENQYRTTTEIAIGDNLLVYPWIRTLVRINKSFIVQRSVGMREMLASSRHMSQYMHFAVNQKHESIWIAQREGRAKDSNDRTQESVLKMMAMGGEGTPFENLKALQLVPLAISYEYDPCDYLKAQEFQLKRDVPGFKKSQQDDLNNMQTGIFGYKGRVHYHISTPVNTWIDEYAALPKGEMFKAIAQRIDQNIHSTYHLYAVNYVAADLLNGTDTYASHYTAEEKALFEKYLDERLALIQIPGKDEAFLRERMLTMYANPLFNYMKAHEALA